MIRSKMISPDKALPGRSDPMPSSDRHYVHGTSLYPPFPDGTEQAIFGMGCFWGAERIFWQIPGVSTTAAGYTGGYTPTPPMKRYAPGEPDTQKPRSLCMTPRWSPTNCC